MIVFGFMNLVRIEALAPLPAFSFLGDVYKPAIGGRRNRRKKLVLLFIKVIVLMIKLVLVLVLQSCVLQFTLGTFGYTLGTLEIQLGSFGAGPE
jgi:hypothetical protein